MAGLKRLLLVDDHPAMRSGLARLLGSLPDLTVVGEAGSAYEAIALVDELHPDVVVCDVLFEGRPDGLDVARALRSTDGVSVLLYSSFDRPWFYAQAVEQGASGYLLKTAPIEELVAAIRQLAAGGTSFPRQVLRAASVAPRSPSPRELEIIEAVIRGDSNAAIGHRLRISDKTVESHLARLFERYAVQSRTELAMHAIRQGWVEQ